MTKKKTEDAASRSTAAAVPVVKPLVPVLLLSISAAEALLALFQWMELLVLRAGGSTVCGINETVNCQAVWETGFAKAVHNGLGIPVAGLGLVWGLAAFAVSAAWAHDLLAGKHTASRGAALKLLAFAGVLSSIVFAGVSFGAGVVCLTCLTTYVVVIAFALVAFKMVPGGWMPEDGASLKGGVVWAAGAAVVGYLALLGPGLATPHAGQSGAERLSGLERVKADPSTPPTQTRVTGSQQAQPGTPSAGPSRPLTAAETQALQFLKSLPMEEQTMVANAAAMYAAADPVTDVPEARTQWGAKTAPVKLVEWVDIRCPHCRALVETLHELKRVVPDGVMSIEPRNYPLDKECNAYVGGTDGTGVRCLAAKAIICLEPTKNFWELRSQLFAEQASLTRERVLQLASSADLPRAQLEKCLASPETNQKLEGDIRYAMKFNPDGTPLAVINGRPAMPFGPFLYALAMAQGDVRSPIFKALPGPQLDAMGGHEGHGH